MGDTDGVMLQKLQHNGDYDLFDSFDSQFTKISVDISRLHEDIEGRRRLFHFGFLFLMTAVVSVSVVQGQYKDKAQPTSIKAISTGLDLPDAGELSTPIYEPRLLAIFVPIHLLSLLELDVNFEANVFLIRSLNRHDSCN